MKSLSVFRAAFNSLSNRYSLVVITALLLAVGIFGYYFYFLVSRSESLDMRQYRVLNRIENQLRVNVDGYKELAIGQVHAAISEVESELSDEEWNKSKRDTAVKAKVQNLINEKMNDVSFVRAAKEDRRGLVLRKSYIADKGFNNFPVPVATAHHDYADSLFSIHVDYPSNFKKEVKVVIGADYTLSIAEALNPLLRTDVFDGYIVLHRDSVVFETMSSGMQKFEPDTVSGDIGNTAGSINSVKSVVINGRGYRVYEVGFSTESETGWTIIGLKSADDFARERRTVPRHYLFAVFIIALFIVCGIPFIKSMIMSRTERLGTTDVLFSAISLALSTSMISILLLDGFLRIDVDHREECRELRQLSGHVEKNLTEEVDSMAAELSAYRKFILTQDIINDLSSRLRAVQEVDRLQEQKITDTVLRNERHKRDSLAYIKVQAGIDSLRSTNPPYRAGVYPGYKNLYLIDTGGKTQRDINNPKLNFDVRARKYVSAWSREQCKQTRDTCPVYLDAIISWREQEFRAAVSLPVADSTIRTYMAVAMTARLRSLTDPVLPHGTGFSVFTEEGSVMFHSDSSRCLNENIIEECDHSPDLIAAINARSDTFVDVEYSGSRRRLFVRPMNDLPYFIGTFSECDPVEAVHGQVFGMAFILQILLFAFYVCLILSGLLVFRRTSRLQHSFLDLSIFTPDVNGNERYTKAIFFNVLYIASVLISACLLPGSLTVLFLFFISAPYTVLLNIILLSNLRFGVLFDRRYAKLSIALGLVVVVVNAIAWYSVNVIWVLLFIIQVAWLLIFYFIEYRVKTVTWFRYVVMRVNYRTTYTLTIFTLVLLTCVVPAVSFSLLTYNKEKEIAVKTTQLQIMKHFAEVDFNCAEEQDPYRGLADYSSSFYGTRSGGQPDSSCPVPYYTYRYDAFSNWMRGLIQSSGEEYNYMSFGASDSVWRWCLVSGDTLVMNGQAIRSCKPDYKYQLASHVPMFELPLFYNADIWVTLRFWIGMVSAIIALYLALRFFTKKIFIHEQYSRERAMKFDESFLRKMEPGYKAFVTGLPAAGKTDYFQKMCAVEGNVHYIDFIRYNPVKEQSTASAEGQDGSEKNNAPHYNADSWEAAVAKAKQTGKGIVLIDHFEHDWLDKDLTWFKLNFIEQLVALKDKKVVIISSMQPGVFTNMLETESTDKKEIEESNRSFERWNRVLAAFYVFTFPLNKYNRQSEKIHEEYLRIKNLQSVDVPAKLIGFIERECNIGLFLRTIGLELIDELHVRPTVQKNMNEDASRKEREDIIISTQKMAETYYRSLWNHLAVEEQFVLYDLAQDGLVNARNLDIVEVLIDKGLVVYDTRLRVMNQSFRNFILTVVAPTDLGKLDIEYRHSGTWNKLKPALILIVCSLFLFIIKSDRTQLFGYFTAFAAIIPVVVLLFSRFNQPQKKE